MNRFEKVPIIRRNGITIYERVVNEKGKLGKYQVMSEDWANDGNVYATFAEAERRMSELKFISGKKNK